jgi:hypothetical protein
MRMASLVFPAAKLADAQIVGLVEDVDISVVPGCHGYLTEGGKLNFLRVQRARAPPGGGGVGELSQTVLLVEVVETNLICPMVSYVSMYLLKPMKLT